MSLKIDFIEEYLPKALLRDRVFFEITEKEISRISIVSRMFSNTQ